MTNTNDITVLFDAPSGTQFLLQHLSLRVLSANGSEVTLPLQDFIDFLLRLDVCRIFCAPLTTEEKTEFLIERELAQISRGASAAVFPLEDLRTFLEHLTHDESLNALLTAIKEPLLARSVQHITSLFKALDFWELPDRVEQRPEAHSKSGYRLSLGGRELRYPSAEAVLTLLQLRLQALFQQANGSDAEIYRTTSRPLPPTEIHRQKDELEKLLDVALRLFAMALASPPPAPRARATR